MNQANKRSNPYFIYFIASIAAFAGLLVGYDTAVISGAILFIRHDFAMGAETTSLIVSSVLAGALLGSVCCGRLSDELGRRKVLLITAGMFLIGTWMTAIAQTILTLILGRFIIGLAIGIASFTAPLYLSEIAPFEKRGALVSLNQLAITIGIVLSYFVDYLFADSGNWRMMLGLGILPALILGLGMLLLPKSPRWMALKGEYQASIQALQKIRACDNVDIEMNAIKRSLQRQQGGWRVMFKKALRPVLIVGILLSFFQQITGINTIIYYAPSIFKMAGFADASSAILATLGVGIVNVIATIVALPLLDKLGRRPMLLTGLAGMALSLCGLTWVFQAHANHPMLPTITLFSLFIYIISFAMSLGPIGFLMLTEIFPLNVRGFGMSIATSGNWACNMIIAFSFLPLVEHIGMGQTFFIFFILTLIAFTFVYLFIPETSGVSLEDIEHNLHHNIPVRHLGQSKTNNSQGEFDSTITVG